MNPLTLGMLGAMVAASASAASAYDSKNGPFVLMDTTLGRIVLELDAAKAPISTLNFIQYCESGHYAGTIFHRVIPTFMIQGGGFTESVDEKRGTRAPIKNEWRNGLQNSKYTIAMARTSDPDSATAQFFINVVDNPFLSDAASCGGAAYAVFGKVVEGSDVVDKIKGVKCVVHPKYPSNDPVTPETPVTIKSATVTGKYDRKGLEGAVAHSGAAEAEAARKAQAAEAAVLAKTVADLEASLKTKAQSTASGLRYLVVNQGSGPKPAATSTVTVHYEGKLLDGKVFDSSYQRGEKISFPLNRVIPGWTEGLQLMSVGAKYVLVIPPGLGYGARGAGGAIPPNAWLVFTVELFQIQ
ncbi:MAG: peptidylprolyl isomerase [Spirochaetes bacterium]|nr:peptidylprolyl isomerase [Spirochaetota bacterium]